MRQGQAEDQAAALSYDLVAPLDWFQLRCLLWEALPEALAAPAAPNWMSVATAVNGGCPASSPISARQCEALAGRLTAALPEGQSLLSDASSGPRAWNHLLYGIVHDRLGSPVFMNLGYADPGLGGLELLPDDEPNRLFIQLYERTVGTVSLRGRDVLEVGCGAGGGAMYLWRYHEPRTLQGIDLVEANIAASRRLARDAGPTFSRGVAEKIDRPDASVDVLINIESSFTYAFAQFLQECHRVLRPGGHVLIADHRPVDEEWGRGRSIREFRDLLHGSRLRVLRDEDITGGVVAASLALAELKQQILPAAALSAQDEMHFREILHCSGSRNHERLVSHRWQYRCVTLHKE